MRIALWYGISMKWPSVHKKQILAVDGHLLVADFHSSLINLVTNEVAQAQAKHSEQNITEALKYSSGAVNGVFIQPTDITPAAAEYVMKNSVDAHLKKVQAEQINSYTTEQVTQLETEDISKYKGRKLRITKLDETKDTFVPLFANNHTGQFRHGTFTGKSITGAVEDMSFENNTLVVVPGLTSRTLVPDRKYFLVHVINMDTLVPAVKIELI